MTFDRNFYLILPLFEDCLGVYNQFPSHYSYQLIETTYVIWN
jgi:hypothetical protein